MIVVSCNCNGFRTTGYINVWSQLPSVLRKLSGDPSEVFVLCLQEAGDPAGRFELTGAREGGAEEFYAFVKMGRSDIEMRGLYVRDPVCVRNSIIVMSNGEIDGCAATGASYVSRGYAMLNVGGWNVGTLHASSGRTPLSILDIESCLDWMENQSRWNSKIVAGDMNFLPEVAGPHLGARNRRSLGMVSNWRVISAGPTRGPAALDWFAVEENYPPADYQCGVIDVGPASDHSLTWLQVPLL